MNIGFPALSNVSGQIFNVHIHVSDYVAFSKVLFVMKPSDGGDA